MSAEKLEIGKIVAIHALKGEMRVQPWCDTPAFMSKFKRMFLDGQEYKVQSTRPNKNIVLVKLQGIDTPELAQKQVNKILYVDRTDIKLDKRTYFIADLIGLQVIDADDESVVYGELTDVSQTGANDVYHIRFADGKTRYIPAIAQVVIDTNLENGVMKIRPLDGLFED